MCSGGFRPLGLLIKVALWGDMSLKNDGGVCVEQFAQSNSALFETYVVVDEANKPTSVHRLDPEENSPRRRQPKVVFSESLQVQINVQSRQDVRKRKLPATAFL